MRRLIPAIVAVTAMAGSAVPAAAQTAASVRTAIFIAPNPDTIAVVRPSSASVVSRILSFDADRDGRVAKEELPERMQGLAERADQDGDGALSTPEVETLLRETSTEPRRFTVSFRPHAFGLADVVSDLRLPQPKHDLALALVKAYPVPRNVNAAASELYARMRELLDDEEYENFVAAAARATGGRRIVTRVMGGTTALR